MTDRDVIWTILVAVALVVMWALVAVECARLGEDTGRWICEGVAGTEDTACYKEA